jgi:dihydroorotate dehydrogenase
MIYALPILGFGWGQVGAITPRPQEGNPKPRVWRFPKFRAVQNAYGFNNDGVEAIKRRLEEKLPFTLPVGANIGKNKNTPEEKAIDDYQLLVKELKELVDFFEINLSSPNTPGLRELLNREFVQNLIAQLKKETDKPLLLKLSPDIPDGEIVELVTGAIEGGVDGIVVTNTTTDYSLIETPIKKGGISGEPLKERSFRVLQIVSQYAFGKVPIVSVGGIDSAQEAYRRIKAGATLLQLYTALIFQGPGIVGEINRGLVELLKKDGFTHISQAIGVDIPRGVEAKEGVPPVTSDPETPSQSPQGESPEGQKKEEKGVEPTSPIGEGEKRVEPTSPTGEGEKGVEPTSPNGEAIHSTASTPTPEEAKGEELSGEKESDTPTAGEGTKRGESLLKNGEKGSGTLSTQKLSSTGTGEEKKGENLPIDEPTEEKTEIVSAPVDGKGEKEVKIENSPSSNNGRKGEPPVSSPLTGEKSKGEESLLSSPEKGEKAPDSTPLNTLREAIEENRNKMDRESAYPNFPSSTNSQ